MLHVKQLVLKWGCLGAGLVTGSCGGGDQDTAKVSSYELQTRTVPECGVEQYNAQRHQACGVESYRAARSGNCGVESYNEERSQQCPGYRATSTYEITKSTTCGGSNPRSSLTCQSGHTRFSYRGETEGCWKNAFDRSKRWHAKAKCRIPEVMNTCRLPEFGVEKYKSCRHSGHGVENYKSCRKPEFGVQRYKSCSLRATKSEVEAKIAAVKANYKANALKLLQHQADYYAAKGGRNGLGCLIANYAQDPLYDDLIEDLKTLYAVSFNTPYPADFTCEATELTLGPCSNGQTSAECQSYQAFEKTKQWFEEEVDVLTKLKTDLVASQNAEIRNSLTKMITDLTEEAKKAKTLDTEVKYFRLRDVVGPVISQQEIDQFKLTPVLVCKEEGVQLFRSVGNFKDGDAQFNRGNYLSGITAKCHAEVSGTLPPGLNFSWYSDKPGLFYASAAFDVVNEVAAESAAMYKIYSVQNP